MATKANTKSQDAAEKKRKANAGSFPKGKSGNPNGRAKGSKNRVTRLKEKVLNDILSQYKTPLEFLLGSMCSEHVPFASRLDCAKAAAPYVHKRMPIQLENSDQGPFRIFDMAKLGGMSEHELKMLMALIEKATPEDAQK